LELKKKLKSPLPKWASNRLFCRNCLEVTPIDFQTSTLLLILAPEEEIEKTREEPWDKCYIEVTGCHNCTRELKSIMIKKIPD